VRGEAHRSTVILVEDDDLFAETLIAALAADPRLEVLARARNGLEGIALAESLAPDVILMDIEMPVLDGVEATRRILAARPQAKVVIVSGSSYEERVLDARDAGAFDYVPKSRIGEDVVAAILAAVAYRLPASGQAR
jgi:DNA-binding NarL/FixJ family response regulator